MEMEIPMQTEDENESKKTGSLKTYGRRPRRRYIPYNIWLEIRSRLPFKSHLTFRLVCKSWRKIVPFRIRKKIKAYNRLMSGILFSSYNANQLPRQSEINLRYICLNTKRVINTQVDNTSDPNLIISSGFERGLCSDLSYDFSPVQLRKAKKRCAYTMHRGLLLVTLKDGTSQVHNPATKQVLTLPKSKPVKEHGFRHLYPDERTGIIIEYPSELCKPCDFLVIRFCRQSKVIEIYDSDTRKWYSRPLKLADVLLKKTHWRSDNYAVFFRGCYTNLCILTTGYVIAVVIRNLQTTFKWFQLPELVREVSSDCDSIRISGCRRNLILLYHNDTGLWIWKLVIPKVGRCEWVPLLEINNTRQFCGQVGLKRLASHVLNPADRVVPLACVPMASIVFLLVKSSILAYHWKEDTIEWIADMKDEDDLRVSHVFPFLPCLSKF